jgi:hypothetical protein
MIHIKTPTTNHDYMLVHQKFFVSRSQNSKNFCAAPVPPSAVLLSPLAASDGRYAFRPQAIKCPPFSRAVTSGENPAYSSEYAPYTDDLKSTLCNALPLANYPSSPKVSVPTYHDEPRNPRPMSLQLRFHQSWMKALLFISYTHLTNSLKTYHTQYPVLT